MVFLRCCNQRASEREGEKDFRDWAAEYLFPPPPFFPLEMAASIAFLHLSSLPFPHRPLISSSSSSSSSAHGNSRLPLSSRALRLATSPALHSAAAAVESVVNPALAHANLMFFNSAYNVQIMVDEGEPEEVLLRRFRREVSKAGVIQECKRRRFFENKQEEKKRKAREAGRRNRRRRFGGGPRFSASSANRSDAAAATKGGLGDEAQDNWEMPDQSF